ncbi:cell envelope integrity protein TolA [Thermomonas sp.]|uniref:cell envelope integrity protein TolA n=1 Tax=Thermomonas sp. TaxID=1971895 RepID=UPI002487C03B|nr:cell envelope integrity protein TolA [Thermomonas sp.]MDI1254338.1 cell envelope integrity protein TolA [Thermomonas sp.]
MKETRADTRLALVQAAGLHILLFALMFAGLHWTRSNVVEPPQGDVIEADLIDPSALSASMRRALQRDPKVLPEPVVEPKLTPPTPEPLPEPVADQMPPPPATVQEPDKVDQEKVQRDAIAPDPAKALREQEAKRRQQQVDLDARQQTEMERQKQLQIAEIRKQREQAQRELRQAEQRAQQLADAKAQQVSGSSQASPPPGNRGKDASLLAQYTTALQQAIVRQWTRPESVEIGQRCRISIRQLPGGEVVKVTISPDCPFDVLGRQSVERAVLKASPLPYAGFEDVFDRTLNVNFVAEDH